MRPAGYRNETWCGHADRGQAPVIRGDPAGRGRYTPCLSVNTALRYALIGALNLALAGAMHLLATAEPKLNDRDAYDYVASHPFAPNCPFSIYCYRVLAPAVVHRLPFDPDTSWRVYQVASNTAAGAVIAIVAGTLSTLPAAPLLASVMAQTSYGFTFTAYDPCADPMVFLIAALLTWCWMTNRPWPALWLSAIGIFVKETVALLAVALALASLLDRRPDGGGGSCPRW